MRISKQRVIPIHDLIRAYVDKYKIKWNDACDVIDYDMIGQWELDELDDFEGKGFEFLKEVMEMNNIKKLRITED